VPANPDFDDLLATAHALADQAGAVILPHFRTGLTIDHKGGALFDPVTAADLAAETAIRNELAATHPAHGIVGEEFGSTTPDADYCWIIDPIDGTRAFIEGRADWTISVALLEERRPLLAALYAPVTDQMFLAERGKGATLNAVPIRVSDGSGFDGAKAAGPKRILERLTKLQPTILPQPKVHSLALRLTRVGSAELEIAFASHGSHDWDLAAADLLVHEAGGVLTDLSGLPLSFNRAHLTHGPLVAAGPARHEGLLALLRDRMPEFAGAEIEETWQNRRNNCRISFSVGN
jgi:myo-inositol-1(or 4)-monophosphatase